MNDLERFGGGKGSGSAFGYDGQGSAMGTFDELGGMGDGFGADNGEYDMGRAWDILDTDSGDGRGVGDGTGYGDPSFAPF